MLNINSERIKTLKSELKETQALRLDDTPRYSEPYSGKKTINVAISPKEQIRYRENRNFSEAVYASLDGLLESATLDADAISAAINGLNSSLNKTQQTVLSHIADRMLAAMENANLPETAIVSEIIPALKDLHFLTSAAAPRVELTPLGAIVLIVDPSQWFLFDPQALRTQAFSIHADALASVADPNLKNLLSRVIIVKDPGNDKEIIRIKKHELFHDAYKRFIEPEQKILCPDPVENRIFSEFKDELIAYAFEGKWQYFLANLSLQVRQEAGNDADTDRGCMLAMGGLVYRSHVASGEDKKTVEDKLDDFTDLMWLNLRELARLHYSNVSTEEINSLLCVQNPKELLFGLRKLGEPGCIDGQRLYSALTADVPVGLPGELVQRMMTFFYHEHSDYKLPKIKGYKIFLDRMRRLVGQMENAQGETTSSNQGSIQELKDLLNELES